ARAAPPVVRVHVDRVDLASLLAFLAWTHVGVPDHRVAVHGHEGGGDALRLGQDRAAPLRAGDRVQRGEVAVGDDPGVRLLPGAHLRQRHRVGVADGRVPYQHGRILPKLVSERTRIVVPGR